MPPSRCKWESGIFVYLLPRLDKGLSRISDHITAVFMLGISDLSRSATVGFGGCFGAAGTEV